MRVIPKRTSSFADLKLPVQLAEIANLRNGVVLVTSPTAKGANQACCAVGKFRQLRTVLTKFCLSTGLTKYAAAGIRPRIRGLIPETTMAGISEVSGVFLSTKSV